MTPLFTALGRLSPRPMVEVLVHPRVARVLDGHPAIDRLLTFDRRLAWLGPLAPGVRALRGEGFEVVVSCANWLAPSLTQSLVCRLIGARGVVIGPAAWPAGLLADVAVAPLLGTQHEVAQRQHLLSPLGVDERVDPLSFRPLNPSPSLGGLLARCRSAPHAVLNPGGRLSSRRAPPEAFAEAARALLANGRTPIVAWGPGEEELARSVISSVPGALLAPPTGMDDLAALMQAAGLTVCNNTGPMHLSVAVGAPTMGLFVQMPMERWGHHAPPHRMVDLTGLAGDEPSARVFADVQAFARSLASEAGGPARAASPGSPL